MKRITVAIVIVVCLLLPSIAQAQGTLDVSNLGLTPTGSMTVASDSWVAQTFFTGTNSGGYVLNTVQLLMQAPSGTPVGFTVSIYDFDSSHLPGGSIGSLSGADPSAAGIFTYSTSGISLPHGGYLVVVTSGAPAAQGAYNWSAGPGVRQGGDTIGADGWEIGYLSYTSADGLNWSYSRNTYFQMAIYATAVPEPSTLALAGLAIVLMSLRRR